MDRQEAVQKRLITKKADHPGMIRFVWSKNQI
jgi:hypothetical protein